MFYKTKISFLFIFFVVNIVVAQDTTQQIVAGRSNSADQQKKPYVILISADGFRYDLADKYNATNLLRLRNEGVNAAYMQPSYPSLTFPNHYSIVTGLYPSHHGIVDNTFYDKQKNETYTIRNKKAVGDGTWYGGRPLWVLAEKQQMLSASFYWVASESAIQGVRPTYYYIYNDAIPIDKRIETVKNWLQLPEDKRPHFITFYFPQVDHQEHTYGPDSKEAEDAVHLVDESVGKLVRTVDSLGLNVSFIFLADHGMLKVDNEHTLPLPQVVDTTKFLVLPGTSLLHLYAKNKKNIQPTYKALKLEAKDYDVYLATKMPAKWHYSKKDDRFDRTGDIILVPHPPKVFNIGKGHIPIGEHGFDPAIPEMRATFYAWGPAFQKNKTIAGFENINVYPLIAKILGLEITDKIDGKLKVLENILAK
ncbi:MAG TPA: ectonucleotide pyrophosphatase/phosphodiesterase [Puia sp.]|jgi:predicted AlkP superfamily pyrophosphatase or phosphodiesterase|nr:ectonucleotide pyrophosphatase/phosphodiesterase [Puia sp.]